MRKGDPRYKEYIKRNNEKRARYRKRVIEGTLSHGNVKHKARTSIRRYCPQIPDYFSLLDNTKETLQYFKLIHESIVEATVRDIIYFNLANVKSASPDAFMYIVAILHNDPKIKAFKIRCHGNEPLALEPRKTLRMAGFFQYVESKSFHPTESEEKLLRINRGAEPNPLYAKKLCDFIHSRTGNAIDRKKTKRLYAMLIELMNNTRQHAFSESNSVWNSKALHNWYSYAEDLDDEIRFVFLDTGLGIPSTIKKTFWEKIQPLTSDAKLMSSALHGEFRTKTGKRFRGKGMPEIYESAKNHYISSLKIFSGKGMCSIEDDGSIDETNLEMKFHGTLFSWTIKKEMLNHGDTN